MALQDLLQGAENAIGGAAQGVGNFVNNDIIHPVEQVFQPQPVQAPIPQNHPMFQAPPIQNFTDWLGNQAQNAQKNIGNFVTQDVVHPIQQVTQQIPSVMNTITTDIGKQPINAPGIGPFQIQSPITVADVAHFAGYNPQSALGQLAHGNFNQVIPALQQTVQHQADIQQAIGTLPSQRTPQQQQLAQQGVNNVIMGMMGGGENDLNKAAFYLRSKLAPEDANVLKDFATYVETHGPRAAMPADLANTAQSIMTDAFGGDAKYWTNQKMKNTIDIVLQRVGQMQNRAGLGLGIQDIREGLQPPTEPSSSTPVETAPEPNPEASIKEQLTQLPLPPKMSSKAITEGLEAPQTGRDVSVSPQAAIRYRIAKNAGVKMTMGNAEPLPWENGNEPTPLSDEWIKQRALPTTPADAGLPPKEDQPVVKISNKEDPVKITNPNGTVRDARAEMDTAKTQIQARGRVVQQLVKDAIDKAGVPEEGGNATNTGANKLFRVAIEHPENEPDILTQVKNPVQFKQALDQFREFTGFNLKAAQDAGAKLKGLKGYYSHIWDLSDPEKAAEFQQLSKASAQNYKGWYNKPRVFKDIAEGESYGFRLKNKNVANDVAEYTNAFAKEQGARVLSNRLVSDFPDKAVILNQGDPTPIDMKQSDIPGAKGLFTSQDIKDQLKDLEPHEKTGLGVKIISNINNIDKQVRLGGGLFHIQNTGLDYLASQVGLGRFPRLITAARTFLDPAFYANYMRGAINDGTIDKMAKANVSLDTEQDFSGKQTGVSKLSKNPLTALNDATFKRLENFFKTEAFRALDNKGLIDTSTPQGVKVAQQYGREINNMFGGQNRVVGDDIFKSSVGRFTSHFGLLAPDYQQGRFKHTFSALGIGNGGGFNPLNRTAGNNYAAYTLALRVAITAMAAEGLRRALTGKFNPNLISVVKNDLLDPNFPTPWQNTSTNGTKENEIAHMPASNLSDWYRAISDPQQFAISHLGAGLSDATAFISNKDYFGNTISQTNNPVEKLFKIGLNDAPIPVVQAGKVISGRVPIGNAIINELGDRVSLDPNDPMALFYAGQKQAMNNLLSKTPDPKMQNALTSGLTQLQSVGALNPNDPRRKQVEYTIYAAFPQLFQVQQQASLAQAGGDPSKADPLFTSPYANEYIEYEQVSSSAPGSSEEKDYLNQHPELIPLIQARAAFYQAHPIAQNPNAPAYIPAPQPNSYVQQQLAAKNYNDPQVQAYLTAHGQYVNNQRQAIGLPMLNSFGQNPMEAAKSNASYQRNQMYSLSRKLKYINKESAYQTKKFKEKNANVNRKYARIRSEKMPVYSARKVAYSPLQNSHYRIVAPPTVKKAGYKAAFKVPANIKYPTLTIG